MQTHARRVARASVPKATPKRAARRNFAIRTNHRVRDLIAAGQVHFEVLFEIFKRRKFNLGMAGNFGPRKGAITHRLRLGVHITITSTFDH